MRTKIESKIIKGKQYFVLKTMIGRTGKCIRFATMEDAVARRKSMTDDLLSDGDAFLTVGHLVREEVIVAQRMAAEYNVSLISAVRQAVKAKEKAKGSWSMGSNQRQEGMSLKHGINKFISEKMIGGLRPRTLASLESVLYRFEKFVGDHPVTAVNRDTTKAWLDSSNESTATKNNLRVALISFFKWAVDIKMIEENPTLTIPKYKETLDEEKKRSVLAPMILSPERTAELLAGVYTHHIELLPYVVLLLFAGLRPSREATHIGWNHVHFKGDTNEFGVIEESDYVEVGGWTTKSRQAREVPMQPNMRLWMRLCKDRNIPLPFEGNIEMSWPILRKSLGFSGSAWQNDCARHSYASYHLTAFQKIDETRTSMGHGNFEMLFKHYRRAVPQSVALRFWALTPESVLGNVTKIIDSVPAVDISAAQL